MPEGLKQWLAPAYKHAAALKTAALIAWAVVTVLWIGLEIAAPRYTKTLDPARIEHYDRLRFEVPLRHGLDWRRLLSLPSDDESAPARSSLLLFEDGRQLGPAHALHQSIADEGHGRYSHWGERILFSASDNSDPKTNGRTYTVVGRLQPYSVMRIIGVAGLFFGGLFLLRRYSLRTYIPVRRTAPMLFDPTLVDAAPVWAPWAAAAGFMLASIAVYAGMLAGGFTTNLSLAGYFPTSDAADYWGCANQLLDYGKGNAWCHRRPIYSMMLGGVDLLAGRNLDVVLYVQAALLGACLWVYAREVARWLGLLPALLAALGVMVFAWKYLLGMTMSEAGGLYLGLLGGALLLRAAQAKSTPLALAGVFVFALGQNVRPGAEFALLLLVVWVGLMHGRELKRMATNAGGAVGAIIAAFIVHAIFVALAGGDPGGSQGNMAMTLYGLTVGGDFTALGQQHPELVAETAANSNAIMQLALGNIAHNPGVVFGGMVQNLVRHMEDQWLKLTFEDLPGMLVYVAGLAAVAVTARASLRASLVLAVTVGELVSAALIENAGGMRLWAASGPLTQFLPILFLLTFLARWLMKAPHVEAAVPAPAAGWRGRLPLHPATYGVLGLLVLALLPPIAGAGAKAAPAAPSAEACAPDQKAVLADLSGAAILTVTNSQSAPASFPRRISMADMNARLGASWYRESVFQVSEMRLLRVVPKAPRPELMPGYFAKMDVNLPAKGYVLLCVDGVERLDLAGFPFYRIMSAHPQ